MLTSNRQANKLKGLRLSVFLACAWQLTMYSVQCCLHPTFMVPSLSKYMHRVEATFSCDCGSPRRFCCSLYISSSIFACASSSRSVMGRLGSIFRTLILGSSTRTDSHQRSSTFSRLIFIKHDGNKSIYNYDRKTTYMHTVSRKMNQHHLIYIW